MTWEEAVIYLRERPDQTDLVRACYYDDPLIEAARRYHASPEWQALRRLLPERIGDALDIGSGRGISAFALASDGWRVSALEPDPSPIVGASAIRALAIEASVVIDVHEKWGEALPFADKSFDVVHCRAVMHHARDLGGLMCEVYRVLRAGGVFVGAREHVVSKHEDIPAFQAAHPLHSLYGGEHAYLLTEYKAAIEGAGLRITHCLNPYESAINLAPTTMAAIKRQWAIRFGLGALAALVPDALMVRRGARNQMPGRLYTFVALKPG